MQDNQMQTHWAYIAGIMDADGCFMISKQKRGQSCKNAGHNFNLSHMAALKISMIEIEAIALIIEMGFGAYNIDGVRKSRPNSKPIFHWYLRQRQEVIKFLKFVIPFLRVKKNRAMFLLEFCERMEKYHNENGNKRVTESELNYREEMCRKMHEFNGNKVAAETES